MAFPKSKFFSCYKSFTSVLNSLYSSSNGFELKRGIETSINSARLCHVLKQPEPQVVDKKSTGNKENIRIKKGPGLDHFLSNFDLSLSKRELKKISHPYVQIENLDGQGRKVFFKVYGCQMNSSDVEVAWSILKLHGYCLATSMENADIILIVTCAIREGAETKIWRQLMQLRSLKNKNKKNKENIKIGVLGCMAERIGSKIIEKENIVDVVAGPDSYRDLPRLLALANEGEKSINILLSHDETYANVNPVSLANNNTSAYVSIMRGCNNMCTYCIVPFTRGHERSRNIESILDEVKYLSGQGIKEITLLGQNVNSYRDTSEVNHVSPTIPTNEEIYAKGFKAIYKNKTDGRRFADLLDKVSLIDPEMRVRFTSPHPKDFPDQVLHIIKERPNICNNLHLPAQCGSTRVLELMQRGYTREAYIELVSVTLLSV
ncbi:UNVERIFIED_CONTAM: hypothetical protein GTU68_009134 [Idotea baltica]|nr:hypothetical protein [Idotea baltica]